MKLHCRRQDLPYSLQTSEPRWSSPPRPSTGTRPTSPAARCFDLRHNLPLAHLPPDHVHLQRSGGQYVASACVRLNVQQLTYCTTNERGRKIVIAGFGLDRFVSHTIHRICDTHNWNDTSTSRVHRGRYVAAMQFVACWGCVPHLLPPLLSYDFVSTCLPQPQRILLAYLNRRNPADFLIVVMQRKLPVAELPLGPRLRRCAACRQMRCLSPYT